MKFPFRKGAPVETVPDGAVPYESLPAEAAPDEVLPTEATAADQAAVDMPAAMAVQSRASRHEPDPTEPDSASALPADPVSDEDRPADVGDLGARRPRFRAIRTVLAWLRPGRKFERYAWLPVGVALAAIVVLVSVYSQTVQSSDQALVLMGFDSDRAQLITALIIAAVGAVVVTLVVNRVGFATLLGLGSLAVLFTQTFVAETQNALAATGALGAFDPVGWLLTLLTLVVIGVVISWAVAIVAAAVRPGLVSSLLALCQILGFALLIVGSIVSRVGARLLRRPAAWGLALRELANAHRPSLRLARRPVAAALVIVLLAATIPAFADMVNLTPDALMLGGNNQGGGLVHDVSFPAESQVARASGTPSPSPMASSSASAGPASSSPSPTPSITAAPGTKPWLAWKPSGAGRVDKVLMLAPWRGGTATNSEIDVYTPPGYVGSGQRTYPVIYEAPTGLDLWGKGTGVISALDTLIDSGQMPASIVVFIDSGGAPYGDTECADMYDGSQWFESYITNTIPTWVETHYDAIPDPKARAIMGMSMGGFCAAMLALRHPDVFGISISFSGYYTAGAGGPASMKPFGTNLDDFSPALLAPARAAEDASKLYFIIVVNPYQSFYGPHATNFEKILLDNGYKYLSINSDYTHGWGQVRNETPPAMKAWGSQLVLNGIW
jgi:enterochelin esterase-like enzyme